MTPANKLGAYVGGLIVVFAAAVGVGNIVIDDGAGQRWQDRIDEQSAAHDATMSGDHAADDPNATDSSAAAAGHADGHDAAGGVEPMAGLSAVADGFTFVIDHAPNAVGDASGLRFHIASDSGHDGTQTVTDFDESHDKKLHLIVVRTDGAHFDHVHPEMNGEGEWSIDWVPPAAGSYRLYADIVPSSTSAPVTLTNTIMVAGDLGAIAPQTPSAVADVDGRRFALSGELVVGEPSELTVEVTAGGVGVENLSTYLGAFGHLVALRASDLGYLHVHAVDEPANDADLAGPTLRFSAVAPSVGTYLLYLDVRIDDAVITAPFVVEARPVGGHA